MLPTDRQAPSTFPPRWTGTLPSLAQITRQPLTDQPPQRQVTYLTCLLLICPGSQTCDSDAHVIPMSNCRVFFKKTQKHANNGIQVKLKI